MVKKIMFTAISIFLIYQSYQLITFLFERKNLSFTWPETVIFALLLNLFVTGIFAFVGFVFPTNKLLPVSYYQIRNAHIQKKIYQVLGVEYFKHFLLFMFWGRANNKKRYFSGSRNGLKAFDFQTRQSEFGHLAAFTIIMFITMLLFSSLNLLLFILTTTINIFGNFYPVILQRMHRTNIVRLLSRVEKTKVQYNNNG